MEQQLSSTLVLDQHLLWKHKSYKQ